MTPESEYPSVTPSFPSDDYRALIVVDPAIVGSAASDAPFTFRSQMQWLAGASQSSLELTRSWLLGWENTSEVGPAFAPVTPRPRVRRVILESWLAASDVVGDDATSTQLASYSASDTPDEASDEGDDTPAVPSTPSDPGYATPAPEPPAAPEVPDVPEVPESGYDPASDPSAEVPEPLPSWDYSPFRLIAIVNRIDLASDACSGFAGEVRYVYAAIDPSSGRPLDLTLILEVPYPNTRTAAEWARAWQELAELPSTRAYAAGLTALTREIQTEGDPLRVRLRSNEIALADPADRSWEMREFQLQIQAGELALVQVPLELTPRADADPAELSAYVLEHSEEIERAGAALPENLRAGAASIDVPDFSWSVLGVSERLRRAFSVQTCNGCHGGDTASLPFRHIGPAASLDEPARLSRFLYDPDAETDELRRRATALEALGAAECAPVPDPAGYPGQ